MTPSLEKALKDAQLLGGGRGWRAPSERARAEAERLLSLVADWRAPEMQVEPDGRIVLEWDAGARGWLQLAVWGAGTLAHSAVIEGDDYGQDEPFTDSLPPWAAHVLAKLLRLGH